MKSLLLMVCVFPACIALAQIQAVAAKDEPFHHPVRTNAYVRVLEVEVPPGAKTQLHQHSVDYFAVVLGPATIENDVPGYQPKRSTFHGGETQLTRGGFAHVVKNLGDTPFRNVTIELLKSDVATALICGPGKGMCPLGTGQARASGTVVASDLFETGTMKATHVLVDENTDSNDFTGHLLVVALAPCRLRAPERELVLSKAGETAWIDSVSTIRLKNVGAKQADVIVLQFQP